MKKFFKFALCAAAVAAFAACSGNNVEKDAEAYVKAINEKNQAVIDSLDKVYAADTALAKEFKAAVEKLQNAEK